MKRIGVLMAYRRKRLGSPSVLRRFPEGLQKPGWVEGRNIRIETRWAALNVEAMQRFAKEFVALQPDLISFANWTHHRRTAAADTHYPHRFRDGCRSGRQRSHGAGLSFCGLAPSGIAVRASPPHRHSLGLPRWSRHPHRRLK